jgi:TonB family protein
LAACIVGAVFFYLSSQNKATAELAIQKEQAEERLKAEAQKARLAEQKAQEEADARQKLEAEYAQKLLQSETARQLAESEALAQTAARLANARGSLVITTNPAGARVTVGNLPPKESPATFTDIRIGTYPITISLPRHEEVKLDLDVAENATTESGVISLVALIGSLQINTQPNGVKYELRPANALLVDPSARRSGVTPAALDDLAPGDYNVTLTRDGWNPHTQVVSISRGATTHLRWAWPNGVVKISSTPEGATVMRDGTALGVTPLTLADQPPGEINYELVMDHYDPVRVAVQVVAGEMLEVGGEFKLEDRIYTINEIDRRPDPIGEKQPELPYYLTLENGRVELQLIVNRDGSTRNVNIVQASNADMGNICLESVAKWRFKPGTKAGEPVNVSLKLPFVFKASR